MPLVKQRRFKFSILCDVFLLNIIIILLSIQINVAYSVPTTTTTIKAIIEPTTTLSITKNTTTPTTVVVTAAATSSIVGTTTSPSLSSLWPIITSTSSSSTTRTTAVAAAPSTATTSIKVEKFNLSVHLQQHNDNNNNNYNLTKSNKDNNHNNNNVSSSSNSSRNNNDNDKILIKKNHKNFNSSINDNNNYNNNGDNNNNNNNNNQNKAKELPIQYAELETLKTLSKRFDIYSDFSKIPFDTIHRILRDEEPEYRMDDQRIQRRWKKSTSTEGITNHNQQKYRYHSYNTKYYHHSIEKRSPTATTIVNKTATIRIDQQLQESSYDDDDDFNVEDNYDKYNNNNNNNNNKNINNMIIEANNLDKNINLNDENNNTSNSSNDSTKTKILLNLENKNFTTLDTIIKQLNRIDNNNNNNNNITNNRIEYINLKNNNLNNFPLNYLNKFINLKYLDLSNNHLKQFHLINNNNNNNNLNNNRNNIKDNDITFQLEILNLSGNQISNLTFDDILPSTIPSLIINSSSKITSKILETIGNDNKLLTSNSLSKYFNKLKELNLSKNSIKSLQSIKNVTMLKNLEIINLSCNQIDKIDKNVFYNGQQQQNKLKYLNLSNNKLNGVLIKDTFQNLINMIKLDLSNNYITKIDLETFQLLSNLQYLDLSNNNIDGDSIHSLQGIPDLIGLSIAYNPKLGDSLQEFVASWSLKELDISGTGLCKIPAALAQSVRSLKLANNWFKIIRCGDLDSYPLLQYLDLSYSQINDIEDDALGRLEILETLFLDHNNLYRIPISLPISLENLFLHNNQIMDIQSQTFQNLINLKILDLSENKIMYLPGLPLPKLLTLNLQSCELRGLSQSVVKTSPKLRDLLLDGNPIKCTDLLGIAEWASPCRNEKYIEPIIDIKTNIQNIHRYFNHFNHNNEQDNKKLCDVNNGNDDCCGNSKMKEVKKPICANVYRNQQNTNNNLNQVHGRIKESQLQKNNDTNSNNDDDDDNNNNNDNDNNDDDSLKLSASFDPVRMNRFEKDMKRTKQENYRNQKKDKFIDKFNTLLEQTSNKEINSKSEVKVYDNQSRILFMTNTTSDIDTPTTNNSGKMNITTSLFLKTDTTKKDIAALQNEHETIIKTSKKPFSDTSTNEQVYKDINNQRNRKNIKYSNSNNNTSILVDARIPILSLLYNSNESLIDNVKHQDENEATVITTTATTTKAITNTIKEEKILENTQQKQQQKEHQKQHQLSEQQQEKRRGTETRIMPNIKSDNNYVETSVLLESMRTQKRKQNESHFESKNENGQQQQQQQHNNNNSKELETKKIIEGKNTSKNIETLPKYNDEHFISSHIINDDNIKDGMNATVHGYINYSADTKLGTIDDGHTDMSIAIKSNQINESKFLMPNKMIQKSEIKESGIILSEAYKDFPINDQSLSDDTNLELKSTTRTIMSQHKSQSNRKLFENNKKKEITKNHNTKTERKVNFPETKSNIEENNFQNNKRKTIKDTTISTELFSTLPSKYDISKIIQFESPAKIITTQKPPNFKILYTTTASATTTKTTASNTIMSTKQIPVKMPSNRNKADEVVFFDQQSVVKKEGVIVSENQNISHSVGGNYHQTETVNQEAVSTNSNYQSQKQHDHLQHPYHHQQQHQHQHQHEQQKHYERNIEQQDEKLFGNQRQRQQESKTMSEGLIQKHLNSETTTVFNNNTNRSLLQRKGYNLNDSQHDKTNENINSPTSDKQNAFDNKDIKYSVRTVSDNIVNRMNGKIPNKEATENTTTYLSSNKFKEAYQVNDVATTKMNATKVKQPRTKQSRKYGNKNQKVQAINLENSPLIKEKNENLQSGINFLAKSSMKNPTQLPESEIKTMTFGNGKHTLLHHTNLNTPKKLGIHETYFDVKDQKILDTKNENHKTDMSFNADKLTTHSLIHHTVNTAILPYTVDDYAFEKSGNRESSNYMPENSLPPTSNELVKLYSPNLDILSSYSNDEPNHQETSNDFEADFKSKYILTTELNRIVPFTDETEQNTFENGKFIHHTSIQHQNGASLVAENSSKTTINNTNYTSTNTNTISNTTISHKFTTASNKSNNNNNNNNNSSSNNNVGGDDNDKGLPPEQWLDIRKAKNHPGLFIVIGVTFGMLLTLGVIHIYRCRRPWYYYYNQKVPHTTTLHNNNFPHFNNHHHHHHHEQQHHNNNNNNTRRQYNDTSHDQYSSRHHSLTTTSSDDYCQCDNDGDYYIEADYESQSSSIRRDFLPMELLSLNGNINDNNDTDDDIYSRTNNRRRNNNGINLHQSRKNSKNATNHHLVDDIW